MNRVQAGRNAEDIACSYLREHSLQVIERNCYLGNSGEIDIIAQDRSLLLFIEVRSFTSNHKHSSQLLSRRKVLRLQTLSLLWLKKHNLPRYGIAIRLDLVAIKLPEVQIDWYQGL